MTITKKHSHQDEVKLSGRLAEFREALKDEIDEVKKSGQTSTLLSAGKRIESNGEGMLDNRSLF